MKAILLLAVVHTLILYQSQKVRKMPKNKVVQQKAYVTGQHYVQYPINTSSDKKNNFIYSTLLSSNKTFLK